MCYQTTCYNCRHKCDYLCPTHIIPEDNSGLSTQIKYLISMQCIERWKKFAFCCFWAAIKFTFAVQSTLTWCWVSQQYQKFGNAMLTYCNLLWNIQSAWSWTILYLWFDYILNYNVPKKNKVKINVEEKIYHFVWF